MNYEINVSLNGKHFFATTERSARTQEDARKLFDTLRERFPKSEGYEVTATRYDTIGTRQDW